VAVLQHLNLPVNYTLLEDDAPARAMVWRRFYTVLLADASLKADYEAVVLAHGRFQTDKALGAALDKRVEFAMADALSVVDASVMPFGDHFPELAIFNHPMEALQGPSPLLLSAAQALGRASAKTFSAKGVELELALSAGDASGVLAALLTGTGTPRKFGEKIVGIETVRQAQDLVLRVQAASQQHEAWDYQQRMARLARALLAEFSALKHARQWVDMNDVERAAQSMLGDPVLSGWVQERLDARIKHLMIDEFQDTNPLQWQALSSWLSGYGGAGGSGGAPSVFLVGDPKQSIYRFRRAEPQVFIAAQAFVVTALGGDLLSCDHTRRNATGVVDTVNTVMAAATDFDGYDGFRPHTTASSQPGCLGRLPPIPRSSSTDDEHGTSVTADSWRDSLTTPRELPEETRRTLESRQAAAWIARLIAGTPDQPGLPPGQIMALSRKRASLMPLRDALQALHIPAQIGEKTELIDCCEVQDIVALLDVLVSPHHDLSLARALRSPLFALGDDELVALAVLRRSSITPWFELLQKTEHLPHSMQGLGAILVRWKGWLGQLPPHDALHA
ncbi:MAG: UvrD-helicase domain-containing protein, partial [Polaromonas sp.]|nr:UvrD-helicase domain-containing protein [Polaromonas sp.]